MISINNLDDNENVTIHIPPGKKRCGLRPLVTPLTGSERLHENSVLLLISNVRIGASSLVSGQHSTKQATEERVMDGFQGVVNR